MKQLGFVIARLAARAGLNINYAFDPIHAWRLGQPLALRKLIAEGGA